jgi:hypothetical protein
MNHLSLCGSYEATDYWVDDAPGGPFKIRCGEPSSAVDRLLIELGLDRWVYITACNPWSRRLPDEQNQGRMHELETRLNELPCTVYHGRGVGTAGNWPPEPSLLVLGLSEEQGLDLGLKFGQAAIVVGRQGENARLAWT